MKRNVFILAGLLCLLAAHSCSDKDSSNQYQTIQGSAQGGTYTVKYEEVKGCPDKQIIADGVDSIFKAVDKSISLFDDTSLIVRYNKGEKVTQDKIFLENKAFADSMITLTNSTIDYRRAHLIQLWINAIAEKKLPEQNLIDEAKKDSTQFTFNAIGQGYTADIIAKYLQSKGIVNYLINNSGELSCYGVNEEGKGWLIAVEAPVAKSAYGKQTLGNFRLPSDKKVGISSSGHYRQYMTIKSENYSHVIDLKTSRPVKWTVLSATVIADNATLADALSSYCMIVGTENAIAMIEKIPGVEGCIVDSEGKLHTSSGFKFE